MGINLNATEAVIRENRLGTVITYDGTARDLVEKSEGCSLICRERSFSQCATCSSYTTHVLATGLIDAVLINHAPIGCAAEFAQYSRVAARPLPGERKFFVTAISTNLKEKDTVFGGTDKLVEAIRAAEKRHHPKAILITASCASGIIGDDIDSTANEMEEELSIPIVPIHCEGFRSKTWSSGWDALFHGLLRKVIKPPQKKEEDLLNFIQFYDPDFYLSPLLAKLGLRLNHLIRMSSIDDIARMSEAAASAHICETLGAYICQGLEQEYGVPEIKTPPPYGLKWTDAWLREIARVTKREHLVEKVIAEERTRIMPELEKIREQLKGKKAYIFAGGAYAHNLANAAYDVGLELVGITSFHHDQTTDAGVDGTNTLKQFVNDTGDHSLTICNKQPYQVVNMLRRVRPDVLIFRHPDLGVIGAKLGIPTIPVMQSSTYLCGYDGIVDFGKSILEVMARKKFFDNIKKHSKLPYTDWWYEQDPFYFEKREDN